MSEEKSNRRQRKSVLWNFFTQIDDFSASCDLCRHKLSYRSTSNNLRKHIQRKHPSIHVELINNSPNSIKRLRLVKEDSSFLEVYDVQNGGLVSGQLSKTIAECVPSMVSSSPLECASEPVTLASASGSLPVGSTQPTTTASNVSCEVRSPTTKPGQGQPTGPSQALRLKSGKFNNKLLHLFIKDFQPYSIVEDVGFQGLVSFLSPTYRLPTQRYISKTAIPELYKRCVAVTKDSIKSGDVFCVSLEVWTSVNSDTFLSVTAHFVNQEFKMTSLLLECFTVTFTRNSENFAYEIRKVVSQWGIEEKIQFVVSENDHCIQNAVTDILGYEYFNCLGDTLNSVVREAISSHEIFKVIEKVSALVSYFKKNTQLYEKLISCQKESGEANVGLKQVSDMRCFRSIYLMLDRFIKVGSTMKNILEVIDDDVTTLTEDEWSVAGQLCQILKPFESVVMTISKETYCPASIVIPVVNGLVGVCESLLKKPFMPLIINAVADVKEAIATHLGGIETSATLSVCTFLDPRFKNLAFSNRELADRAKEVVVSALAHNTDDRVTSLNASQSEEIVEEELTVWHVFDQVVAENRVKSEHSANKATEDELSVWSAFDNAVALSKPKVSAASQALAEVRRYLDAEILPRQENPLQWWNDNKQLYPQLTALARSQLGAVCMAVPCDRIFTKAGVRLTERRNKLNETNTKMLVVLNANMPIYKGFS